jgi:hypothetical protein
VQSSELLDSVAEVVDIRREATRSEEPCRRKKCGPDLGTIWPAIVVGVTVFFLAIVASLDLRSVVPANVYGYAAPYSLHQPSAAPGPLQNLLPPSFANPLVLLIVSMAIGTLFGWLRPTCQSVIQRTAGQRAGINVLPRLVREISTSG